MKENPNIFAGNKLIMIIDPEFQTPIPVCKYMVKMLPKDVKTVLEPSPGMWDLQDQAEKQIQKEALETLTTLLDDY